MNYFPYILLTLCFSACSWNGADSGVSGSVRNPVRLVQWSMHAGTDTAQQTLSAADVGRIRRESDWIPIVLDTLPPQDMGTVLWLKTTLQADRTFDRMILLGRMTNSVQVFLDDSMIYSRGNFAPEYYKYSYWRQNLFHLPALNTQADLVLRVRIEKDPRAVGQPILTGDSGEMYGYIFMQSIPGILAVILIVVTVVLVAMIIVLLERTKLMTGIILFLLCSGVWISVNTPYTSILLPSRLLYYCNFIFIFADAILFYFLLEQIAAVPYRHIVRWIQYALVFMFCVSAVLNESTTMIFKELFQFDLIFFVVFIAAAIVILVKSLREVKYELTVFLIGMLGFIVSMAAAAVTLSISVVRSESVLRFDTLPVGILFFIVSLAWLAVKKGVQSIQERERLLQKDIDAAKQSSEVLRQFTVRLLDSQEAERNRIALELHDSVGQKLLLIRNMLLSRQRNLRNKQVQAAITEASEVADDTIQEIRNITYNLRPKYLDQLGLAAAVESLSEKTAEASGISITTDIDAAGLELPGHDEINIFRIIQESVNNIVKHSGADRAAIRIKKAGNHLSVEITDNGGGMRDDAGASTRGLGLEGMKERAAMIGASICIDSAKTGTTVRLDYHLNTGNSHE